MLRIGLCLTDTSACVLGPQIPDLEQVISEDAARVLEPFQKPIRACLKVIHVGYGM